MRHFKTESILRFSAPFWNSEIEAEVPTVEHDMAIQEMQGHVHYFSYCCERDKTQLREGRVCLLLRFKKGHSPLGQGRQSSQNLRQRVVLLLETGNRQG